MPNQFFSEEFGDLEDYFVTDYELMERYIGDNLYIWGRNNSGQLGVNNSTNRDTPLTIFNNTRNWKECSLSGNSGIAIKTDGTLWTWGGYSSIAPEGYILGINQGNGRSTPVTTILGGNNWKTVAKLPATTPGTVHAAIKTDGTLWLWGSNFRGHLGVNDTTTRSTPVTTLIGGNNWKSISMGDVHAVAIKTDGTLWTWGRGQNGTLGINDTIDRSTPVTTLLGGNDWKMAVGLEDGTVAIKTDGTLWTWGLNNTGQLGGNDTTSRSTPVTTLLGGNDWKFADGGNWHTAAIKTDGTLWCWGYIINGQIGINTSFNGGIPTPVTTILGGNNWKTCVAGERNTAAIKTDGTLWIWGGSGGFGGLGIGDEDIDNVDRLTPITTVLGGNNWKSISLGYGNSAAIQLGANIDALQPTEVLYVGGTASLGGVFVVPDGVTSVSVVCIGGGGGGGRDTGGYNGSGGGGLAWKNNISVTPGQKCSFQAGGGGAPGASPTAGGASWFLTTTTVWAGGGGIPNVGLDTVGAGGTFIGDGGGNGGNGGSRNGSTAGTGGGGGAGGYEGNGGNGGGFFANAAAGAGFTGSGGGGGGGGCGGSADTAGAGGGVSPYGIGLSGSGGAGSGADGHGGFGGGAVRTSNFVVRQAQYDAVNANVVNQAANTYSATVTADAGSYGGGAGGSDIVTSNEQGRGGFGCVRIVWTPGYTFP